MLQAETSLQHPQGLTTAQAEIKRREFGTNTTPDAERGWLRLVLGKFFAPVPCLLEAAMALQIYLGEYIEASVIGVLVLFNASIGLLHEGRAQATIAALKARLALVAAVQRDGKWCELPVAELVPDDIVKLSLGGVVPADVRLIDGMILLDQSMITGESLPVEAGVGVEACAGALVRRGEATAVVTATGVHTKFGRTAELVRTAHVTSEQQKAIFRVVRNLAFINGVITAGLISYASYLALPIPELVPLILLGVLATVPVALPATFTLATAIGAQTLARKGVLPTRLSAVDEAASMDLLCADKTGTLTRNELAVTRVQVLADTSEGEILGFAALASSEGGLDPVDKAVRAAAAARPAAQSLHLSAFRPFDPATKMAEADAVTEAGEALTIAKGAFAFVAARCLPVEGSESAANALETQGYRVLGVAAGTAGNMRLVGLIALSDPPREDAAPCIARLRELGLKVVIISGDAAATAAIIGRQVGVTGPVHASGKIGDEFEPGACEIFAGVLPEDKFTIVKAYQRAGHVVGMCGDGANDAPALRQAQIGIAVLSATDVAKSAAGIVLTEPGLNGIVEAVQIGRVTFQRILTYTLRSIVHKVRQVLFLSFGLYLTGHAILTPMMMVISMITGDFLAMSATTDNVVASPRPNSWRVGRMTVVGALLGISDLVFCAAVLMIGKYALHLSVAELQTLTLVTLVFSGQAIFYVVRERRRLWASRPSRIVVAASIADLVLIPSLAVSGTLMAPIPVEVAAAVFAASILLALVLDAIKVLLFRWLQMV